MLRLADLKNMNFYCNPYMPIGGPYLIPMALKRHLWYTNLALITLKW